MYKELINNSDKDFGVYVKEEEVKHLTIFVLTDEGEVEYSLNHLINTFELSQPH